MISKPKQNLCLRPALGASRNTNGFGSGRARPDDRRSRALHALFVALALGGAALSASSAAEANDVAAAEALFADGAKLFETGSVDAACQKFAESQRLDPSSGTALNLARCYERQGKTASAWAAYLAARRLATTQGRSDRAEEAATQATRLEATLSHLTIRVTEPVDGLNVSRDGAPVEVGSFGTQIPVDSGVHVVRATRIGFETWERRVNISASGESQVVEIPALRPSASRTETKAATVPSASEPIRKSQATDHPVITEQSHLGTYIVGGIGVAGLGLAGGFGLAAKGAYDDAANRCESAPTNCDATALGRAGDANTLANAANVAFGVGVAGLGLAVFLFLTEGEDDDEPAAHTSRVHLMPTLGPSIAGANLTGAF